jgi:hypothetical protein
MMGSNLRPGQPERLRLVSLGGGGRTQAGTASACSRHRRLWRQRGHFSHRGGHGGGDIVRGGGGGGRNLLNQPDRRPALSGATVAHASE